MSILYNIWTFHIFKFADQLTIECIIITAPSLLINMIKNDKFDKFVEKIKMIKDKEDHYFRLVIMIFYYVKSKKFNDHICKDLFTPKNQLKFIKYPKFYYDYIKHYYDGSDIKYKDSDNYEVHIKKIPDAPPNITDIFMIFCVKWRWDIPNDEFVGHNIKYMGFITSAKCNMASFIQSLDSLWFDPNGNDRKSYYGKRYIQSTKYVSGKFLKNENVRLFTTLGDYEDDNKFIIKLWNLMHLRFKMKHYVI